MPELPEVETTRRGISPSLINQSIERIIVRQPKLRHLVNDNISEITSGLNITDVSRRAKYLIIHLEKGYFLVHLGMSGHLRLVNDKIKPEKHDHIDLCLKNGVILRYNDPRRFGLWLYEEHLPHPLLAKLGPEPLLDDFSGEYLYKAVQKRVKPIKTLIMDNHIVVGVGNIYASESLFEAKIHPLTPAKNLSYKQCESLCEIIKDVLAKSIKAGGTTLKDFYAADGKPGYFVNELLVYGRKNKPCNECSTPIDNLVIGGRNTFYCPKCQSF